MEVSVLMICCSLESAPTGCLIDAHGCACSVNIHASSYS